MKNPYAYIVEHAQSIGNRSKQEDAILYSDESVYERKGILAVLSDGMGGLSDGEKFSALATECMVRHFENTEPMEDICEELRACFDVAQRAALVLQKDGSQGGATVVAVLIRNWKCAFLSVGDSSICLLRNGGLIHLNRKHTLGVSLDESVALGYLDEEFARSNIHRNSLTSHLGSENEIKCDVCSVPFSIMPGDRIALMSDGITGTLDEEELTRLLGKGTCENAANCMIGAVLRSEKPRQDNASILIIGFEKIRC